LDTLAGILLYHVVAGSITAADLTFEPDSIFTARSSVFYLETLSGADIRFDVTPLGVMLDGEALVTVANIETSNGLIHVIDRVIMPPADIVSVAVDAGFESLAAAVTQAELVEVLQSAGPFTVFAPVEAAFAALGEETLASLFENENRELLAGILTYHVIPGKVYASMVGSGAEVETVNGASVTFSLNEEGGLMINGAHIIATDIRASNGVIHIIDSVILPPEPEPLNFEIGFDAATFNYTINDVSGAAITWRRGNTYTLTRGDFSGHPFTLSTSAPGVVPYGDLSYGGASTLTGAGQSIVYTPGPQTPAILYYRCTVHPSMGGVITVTD
jgi:uncharacterized surface protein with fasciclin (FAS1) repeats